MKPTRKKKADLMKLAERALQDGQQEKWESGELGRDADHARAGEPLGEPKNFPTSIRLPRDLVESLRDLASEEGLSYQSYLKMVLTKHVKAKKKAG